MAVLGILVLTGYFQFRGSTDEGPSMINTIFGVVLILYGIYRVAVSDSARRRKEREQRERERYE